MADITTVEESGEKHQIPNVKKKKTTRNCKKCLKYQ